MTTHSHTNIPYKYASLHLHIDTFTENRGELTQKITKTLLTSILELFYIPNVTEITNRSMHELSPYNINCTCP